MDDERRSMKRQSSSTGGEQQQSTKPTELRWKKGCFRSQNQCNDKWDNLMRHYKKVRIIRGDWIYRALSEVVERNNGGGGAAQMTMLVVGCFYHHLHH
ncbi:hypothetical protein Ancab_019107 [Ancistrocladus abbreviatus]